MEAPAEHVDWLRQRFGHASFRPQQWAIISAVLGKRDCLAVMATGHGKSLCYQYPPVFGNYTAVVVSPLIALMQDQVGAMEGASVPACFLGSAQTKAAAVIDKLMEDHYRLLYVTPEFVLGEYGMGLIRSMGEKIGLVAVDEAHCVSQWGHDFRPQYTRLAQLRALLPGVPWLAVTATANEAVRQDIGRLLGLQSPLEVCASFDRPNLQLRVEPKAPRSLSSALAELRRVCCAPAGCAIVYCLTRAGADEVCDQLQRNGLDSAPYHAGLGVAARRAALADFVGGRRRVVVATLAFGMGVDRADVRLVLHLGAPRSLEHYWQEAGRAGRDGRPALCWLLYSPADFDMHAGMGRGGRAEAQRLREMRRFVEVRRCRRRTILEHFGEEGASDPGRTGCCDVCDEPPQAMAARDYTAEARLLLQACQVFRHGAGVHKCVLFLRGSRNKAVPTNLWSHSLHGKGVRHSETWWRSFAALLEREDYLTKEGKRGPVGRVVMPLLRPGPKGECLLAEAGARVLLEPTQEMDRLEPTAPGMAARPVTAGEVSQAHVALLAAEETQERRKRLFQLLAGERLRLAHQANCQPFEICSNLALTQIAQRLPTTLEELEACADGFSDAKLEAFGDKILHCVTQFLAGSEPNKETSEPKGTSEPKEPGEDLAGLLDDDYFEGVDLSAPHLDSPPPTKKTKKIADWMK